MNSSRLSQSSSSTTSSGASSNRLSLASRKSISRRASVSQSTLSNITAPAIKPNTSMVNSTNNADNSKLRKKPNIPKQPTQKVTPTVTPTSNSSVISDQNQLLNTSTHSSHSSTDPSEIRAQQQLMQFQEQLFFLEQGILERDSVLGELQNENNYLRDVINQINNTNQDILKQKNLLEKEKKKNPLAVEIADMKKKYAKIEEKCKKITQEKSDLQKTQQVLDKELKELKKKNVKLEGHQEKILNQQKLLKDLERMTNELEEVKNSFEREREASEKYREINETLTRENEEKQAHLSAFIQEYQSATNHTKMLESALDQLDAHNKQLMSEIDNKQSDINHLSEELNSGRQHCEAVESELKEKSAFCENISCKLEEATLQLHAAIRSLEEREEQTKSFAAELDQLQDQLQRAIRDNQEKQSQINIYEGQIVTLKQKEAELQIVGSNLLNEQTRNSELTEANTRLNSLLTTQSQKIDHLERNNQNLKKTITELESVNDYLSSRPAVSVSDTSELNERIHNLTAEIDLLKSSLEKSEAKRLSNEVTIETLLKQNDHLKLTVEDMKGMKDKVEQLEASNLILKRSKETYEVMLNEKRSIARPQELQQQEKFTAMSDMIEKLTAQNKLLHEQVITQQSELGRCNEDFVEMEKRIRELEEENHELIKNTYSRDILQLEKENLDLRKYKNLYLQQPSNNNQERAPLKVKNI
ncbi:predicted protein [Naegleria gruberi]|uniref:Predicted protein n=1 Tax=Naegleria gruberi TaxID=5762 RepID=D2VK53_NAEGR|nr:uncharacterized protein NAEGRDRAFT_69273 [Naegleria gruberi]EFC42887.1 predicted protein [Naegleria gruberi]|eukprot:XP_002675631.1 predicted protein [Naegleria gruberi strain NEG-M]